MSTGHTHYQSYLLRLWRNEAGELLHASLQSTESGGIFHLKDMNELLVFLSLKEPDENFYRVAPLPTQPEGHDEDQ